MCSEHVHRRSIYSLLDALSHQAEGKIHADTQREEEGERPARQLTNEPEVARDSKRQKGPSFPNPETVNSSRNVRQKFLKKST